MVALYAAICSVKEGGLREVEVHVQETTGDTQLIMTITIRGESLNLEVGDEA